MAPIELPPRATRGRRMKAVVEEEEANADSEFWNQEFFAEDQQDIDYQSEAEEEDVPDSDFDEPESTDDEEGEEVAERPRKKALLPPGSKPAPKPKPKQRPAPAAAESPADADADAERASHGSRSPSAAASTPRDAAAAAQAAPPALRQSTREAVAKAQLERQSRQKKPRRRPAPGAGEPMKQLTQEELLAEAARTEIENLASLKLLVALEEETKRRATTVKVKYSGPLIKWRSYKRGEEALVTLEPRNMRAPPQWLRRQVAPPPPPSKPVCSVTGQPAKYLDPVTGSPFATSAAFRRLRDSNGSVGPAATRRRGSNTHTTASVGWSSEAAGSAGGSQAAHDGAWGTDAQRAAKKRRLTDGDQPGDGFSEEVMLLVLDTQRRLQRDS